MAEADSDRLIRLLRPVPADMAYDPLGIAVRRQDDVGYRDRVLAGFDPTGAVTVGADRALAAEADQVDLGVPLAVAVTDRAARIERAVAGLKRHDVERMRAVRAGTAHDLARM